MNRSIEKQLRDRKHFELTTTCMDRSDVFSTLLRVTHDLSSHLRDSFGPMGKQVIVVDEVGKVSLTKNGLQIVKALGCIDPVARMIVSAVQSHVNMVRWICQSFNQTQDGNKMYRVKALPRHV